MRGQLSNCLGQIMHEPKGYFLVLSLTCDSHRSVGSVGRQLESVHYPDTGNAHLSVH